MTEDERTYSEALGKRIVAARGKLTQLEMAEHLGVSKNTMLRYEKGVSVPDLVTIRKICATTGVSLEWLSSGEGEMFGGSGQGMAQPDPFDSLGIVEGTSLLTEIYSSGDSIYIRAISANLLAFSDAVKTKAKAKVMEETIHDLQTQILEMREQMMEMKKEILSLRNENADLRQQLKMMRGNGPEAATG